MTSVKYEKGLNKLAKKYSTLTNVDKDDKKRFRQIINWIGVMLDLQIKEKMVRDIYPKRGEIWTCHFGENIGSEVNKIRPCLIIQTDIGNLHSPTTIVCPISHKYPIQPTHVELGLNSFTYREGEISGTILTEQIKTVSKARLGRKIGELSEETLMKVEKAIGIGLNLSSYITG